MYLKLIRDYKHLFITGKFAKKYMRNIQRIRDNTVNRRKRLLSSGIKRPKTKFSTSVADNDYGLAEPLLDIMDDEELIQNKEIFLDKLYKVDSDQLEYLTREQNQSQKWFNERKKRQLQNLVMYAE